MVPLLLTKTFSSLVDSLAGAVEKERVELLNALSALRQEAAEDGAMLAALEKKSRREVEQRRYVSALRARIQERLGG
jgi:hypothetical protein